LLKKTLIVPFCTQFVVVLRNQQNGDFPFWEAAFFENGMELPKV